MRYYRVHFSTDDVIYLKAVDSNDAIEKAKMIYDDKYGLIIDEVDRNRYIAGNECLKRHLRHNIRKGATAVKEKSV